MSADCFGFVTNNYSQLWHGQPVKNVQPEKADSPSRISVQPSGCKRFGYRIASFVLLLITAFGALALAAGAFIWVGEKIAKKLNCCKKREGEGKDIPPARPPSPESEDPKSPKPEAPSSPKNLASPKSADSAPAAAPTPVDQSVSVVAVSVVAGAAASVGEAVLAPSPKAKPPSPGEAVKAARALREQEALKAKADAALKAEELANAKPAEPVVPPVATAAPSIDLAAIKAEKDKRKKEKEDADLKAKADAALKAEEQANAKPAEPVVPHVVAAPNASIAQAVKDAKARREENRKKEPSNENPVEQGIAPYSTPALPEAVLQHRKNLALAKKIEEEQNPNQADDKAAQTGWGGIDEGIHGKKESPKNDQASSAKMAADKAADPNAERIRIRLPFSIFVYGHEKYWCNRNASNSDTFELNPKTTTLGELKQIICFKHSDLKPADVKFFRYSVPILDNDGKLLSYQEEFTDHQKIFDVMDPQFGFNLSLVFTDKFLRRNTNEGGAALKFYNDIPDHQNGYLA